MAESNCDHQGGGASNADRIQCHVISNTHWDREWKYSAARHQHMLVHVLDMVLDLLGNEPGYGSFHLDSQTIPLLDYLKYRPEREAEIRGHVDSGRLVVGPWYCLPDEFCVSGESLIRNLLLGHRIARSFGKVSKCGYSPFSWGQVSQMPQIYRGFGIDVMMFYRGVNARIAPRSEFIWAAPDGTEIIASRLAARPRYNVWYVLQRPAYWGARLDALNDFSLPWSCGHGMFHMADEAHATLDYKLVHPRHLYDAAIIPDAARQALREQDADWSTPHRLWSIGHDASCPDAREVRMVADAADALKDEADVFSSDFEGFSAAIRESRCPDWPKLTGEMRHAATAGSSSVLLGWILSARSYLKQDNFRTEQALIVQAEPLAVCARMLGAAYPRTFLDRAYALLLQNHAHDSIGGCGRDVVHDEIQTRLRQVREISTCVVEQALMDITGTVDLSGWAADDLALVVYNPLARSRSEVAALVIDTPPNWSGFEILDEHGRLLPFQAVTEAGQFEETVHSPNDVFNFVTARRQAIRVALSDIPGIGYRTFRIRSATREITREAEVSTAASRVLENEFLHVLIHDNGTYDVTDKRTGRSFTGLGYFRDSGAAGNPWQHESPPEDQEHTTESARAEISPLRQGDLETVYRIGIDWALPESLADDGRSRSSVTRSFPIVNTLTLRQGMPWLEVVTELDNTVRDHYLRVCFPMRLSADTVQVQSPFDVVSRPIALPDHGPGDEAPQAEQPMHAFVDMTNGEVGAALLNEGLKAYEACDDVDRTINLTLLRALRMRFFVPEKFDHPELAAGSQCPGPQVFRYAFMPHSGDWVEGGVWGAAERFNAPLLAAQLSVTPHGHAPLTRSFVEVDPPELTISAIKQSERGEGWIVRLFNPLTSVVRGRLRLNGGHAAVDDSMSPRERVRQSFVLPARTTRKWGQARVVSLEEVAECALPLDEAGWAAVELPAKRILTIEFLPRDVLIDEVDAGWRRKLHQQ